MTEIKRLREALEKEARAVVDETLYRGEGYELVRSMDKVLDQIAALSTPPAAERGEWQDITPEERHALKVIESKLVRQGNFSDALMIGGVLKNLPAPPSPRTPEGQ